MNFAVKNVLAALVILSAVSAQAQTKNQKSKTQLLQMCSNPKTIEQAMSVVRDELRASTELKFDDINTFDAFKSGDYVVQQMQKNLGAMQNAEIKEELFRGRNLTSIAAVALKAVDQSLAATAAKFGRNETLESMVMSLQPMLSTMSLVTTVAIHLGEAKLKGITLSSTETEKLSAEIQTALEKIAVLKVRVAGIQAKVDGFSDAEKTVLTGQGQFFIEQLKANTCRGTISLIRK